MSPSQSSFASVFNVVSKMLAKIFGSVDIRTLRLELHTVLGALSSLLRKQRILRLAMIMNRE